MSGKDNRLTSGNRKVRIENADIVDNVVFSVRAAQTEGSHEVR